MFEALRIQLEPQVELIEVDAYFNDPALTSALVNTFHRLCTGGKEVARDSAH